MDDCDNCDAKKAAYEACMMRESTSLSGMKYFGSGAIVGAALTLAVPRGGTSVWSRQAPCFVLGLSGIAADYYAIQSLCARESGGGSCVRRAFGPCLSPAVLWLATGRRRHTSLRRRRPTIM